MKYKVWDKLQLKTWWQCQTEFLPDGENLKIPSRSKSPKIVLSTQKDICWTVQTIEFLWNNIYYTGPNCSGIHEEMIERKIEE